MYVAKVSYKASLVRRNISTFSLGNEPTLSISYCISQIYQVECNGIVWFKI